MKLLPILGTLVVVGLTSTPAFALYCSDKGPSVGFEFDLDHSRGPFRTNPREQQMQLDMQRLRSVGVYANSVERWNGCIRAYVTQPDGRQSMEFYDPTSLQRLQ